MLKAYWFLIVLILAVAFFNLYIGTRTTVIDGRPSETEAAKPLLFSKEKEDPTQTLQHNDEEDEEEDLPVVNINSLERLRDIPKRRSPTHTACQSSQGVYHIQMGDIGGAAGTIFFQFVVSQILYAERYNLTPWIYLNNVSEIVYDPTIHGQQRYPSTTISEATQYVMVGRNATYIRNRAGHVKDAHPGPPDLDQSVPVRLDQNHRLDGTGVWEHYFQPISSFAPGDTSCHTYVTMDLFLITPGLHGFTSWAPRCWRYPYLPEYITQPHIPLEEWLEPQRKIAHRVVKQYIQFRPAILKAAEAALRLPSPNTKALGLHIRHSDKAAGRRVVETHEFLPFAVEFLRAVPDGVLYVATDSTVVLEEIRAAWPYFVQKSIRTYQAVRSNNATAVFDMGHHHQVNVEILIEIQALASCDYLIHGLSAVSESALWIQPKPHVNLEDPDDLTSAQFAALLQQPNVTMVGPTRTHVWWNVSYPPSAHMVPHPHCADYDGVLLISNAGGHGTGRSFFTQVLNQLQYAERHNLLPWIHLKPSHNEILFDEAYHASSVAQKVTMMAGMSVTVQESLSTNRYPGKPALRRAALETHKFVLEGTGIWDSYFEPVKGYCPEKALIEMESELITGIELYDPTTIRAWRYDEVSKELWEHQTASKVRDKAHGLVKQYFQVRPHLLDRVNKVFPTHEHGICLGVHIRSIDKQGKFRTKIKISKYLDYMRAFVEAGGQCIYVATDSRSALDYLRNQNRDLSPYLYHQGNQTVRSFKRFNREWPPHFYASHHRVNSETLVDILALSQCQYLLHGFSTVSEAATYFNPNITAINLEHAPILTDTQLKDHVKEARERLDPKTKFTENDLVIEQLDNTTIIRQGGICQRHAIVYLAQKMHSSYGRDSFSILLQSMKSLKKNYLLQHGEFVDVFVFHSGDFQPQDIAILAEALGQQTALHLVDLSGSPYWSRPIHHAEDNPADWYAWPLFSEGYRRMMHWFAIDIWRFFARYNDMNGCSYRYIWRLDEDSFLHSRIYYNIFEKMERNSYVYGFRMCAYELKVTQRMFRLWKNRHSDFIPYRDVELEMCGFYNNLFVADLEFFNSPNVTKFLRFIDRQGHIYRRRLGDLMIHSMAVYGFAPPNQIHRFLDFTYEHATINSTDGCLEWGGIQAGFDDENAARTVSQFYDRFSNCSNVRPFYLKAPDLSPTYAHVPEGVELSLFTVTAGAVETSFGKGILTG